MGILSGNKAKDFEAELDALLDEPAENSPVSGEPALLSTLGEPEVSPQLSDKRITDRGGNAADVEALARADADAPEAAAPDAEQTSDGRGVDPVDRGDGSVAERDATVAAGLRDSATPAEAVESGGGSGSDAPAGASGQSVPYGAFAESFSVGDIANITDLRNFAIKVTLRTRRWHAQKKDTKAAQDVAQMHQAKGNVGTFRKNLLPGADAKLKAVHRAIDTARADHYSMTLPWSMYSGADDVRRQGPRLLPNAAYFDYVEKMAGHKQAIRDALDEFCPAYEDDKAKARENLGDLFNEGDYPAVSSIRDQFALDVDFEPLPDANSLRESSLDKQQAEKLAELMNERTRTMLDNAMRDVWNRLYDTVTHMAERLSDPDKTFHKTMLTNAEELCKVLARANFTGDERLDQMRRELEGRLLTHDASELRKNPEIRKAVADDAKRVLDTLKGYGLGSA